MDCKVIHEDCLTSQHKVVMDIRVKIRVKRKNQDKVSRIKWWQLKKEKQRSYQHRVLQGGLWENTRKC